MFRPDSNDPLVEDNGLALYEVLVPLSEIVHAYIMSSYSLPTRLGHGSKNILLMV